MLSMELARRFAELPQDGVTRELVLHLIASHHGHGRPFAPVVLDSSPQGISGRLEETDISLDAAARACWSPTHRLDSGVAERFWRLTRRYGWWGLGYLEALLRLADWYASNFALDPAGDA
jgi:CRISPR-associated endonuclease/helicase Cas3